MLMILKKSTMKIMRKSTSKRMRKTMRRNKRSVTYHMLLQNDTSLEKHQLTTFLAKSFTSKVIPCISAV